LRPFCQIGGIITELFKDFREIYGSILEKNRHRKVKTRRKKYILI
ncbi:jg26641, partial [Pararge aegeria aegeria]